MITAMRFDGISAWNVFSFIVACFFCFACFSVEWKLLSFIFAKYEFAAEGVRVTYLGRRPQILPWEDFQEICVCYADYYARVDGKLTKVICFIKAGEKKNVFGRWKVDNFLRYRTVIRLNYSPALYQKIADTCPYDIVNYCKTKNDH